MTALPRRVEETIAEHRLFRRRDRVLVAVSGGPDSIALLHALVRIGRWPIEVGHVNHGLRGRDSERDEAFVRKTAEALGIPVSVRAAPIRPGPDLEERARVARYEALARIAHERGLTCIATAHTEDDQAETVLHRLVRGSGTAGLGGIARRRGDGVVRPLLDASRADVLRFLAREGLRYRTDRSNASPRFTRNRVRSRVLPVLERELNPRTKAALARAADLLREDDALLTELAERRLRQLAAGGALDCRRWPRTAPALERRILRAWLARERGGLGSIGFEHVAALRKLARWGADGEACALPGGSVVRRAGQLSWRRGPFEESVEAQGRPPQRLGERVCFGGWTVAARTAPATVRPSRFRAVFDLAAIDRNGLVVRTRKDGDRIRVLGLGGRKKIHDVFVDAKVPREERAGWPLVEHDGEIVWVPGLCRSAVALVSAGTRRVLVVEARRGGHERNG